MNADFMMGVVVGIVLCAFLFLSNSGDSTTPPSSGDGEHGGRAA